MNSLCLFFVSINTEHAFEHCPLLGAEVKTSSRRFMTVFFTLGPVTSYRDLNHKFSQIIFDCDNEENNITIKSNSLDVLYEGNESNAGSAYPMLPTH